MKVRVPVSAVRVGMFIDSMEGSWWLNPFWKTRFQVTTPKQVATLVASDLQWVVIDTDRGSAPDATEQATPPRATPPAAAPSLASSPRAAAELRAIPHDPPARTRSADPALQRAAAMVDRSKREVMRMFADARMGRAVHPQAMAGIVDDIYDAVERDVNAVLRVTRLKRKNEYTYLHSVAVSALMIALGRYLRLDDAVVRELGLAGLLHDIGKVAVPESILEKPDRLTDGEMQVIRTHPEQGLAMLADSNVPPLALDVIAHHHEKIDGTGYPHGLSGEAVSIYARMAAVCDVYDAVTSKRSYKRTWTPSEALTRMREWRGHFDPQMLDAFMRCVGIFPVGMVVRLRSNRLAIVLNENRTDPTRPMVRAFFRIDEHAFVPPADLRISTSLKDDAVVAIEEGESWFGCEWERVREAVMERRCPETHAAATPRVAAAS